MIDDGARFKPASQDSSADARTSEFKELPHENTPPESCCLRLCKIYSAILNGRLLGEGHASSGTAPSGVGVEVSSFMVEVQIVRIEHRDIHHSRHVQDVKLLALQLDQPVAAQFLERTVDVDGS